MSSNSATMSLFNTDKSYSLFGINITISDLFFILLLLSILTLLKQLWGIFFILFTTALRFVNKIFRFIKIIELDTNDQMAEDIVSWILLKKEARSYNPWKKSLVFKGQSFKLNIDDVRVYLDQRLGSWDFFLWNCVFPVFISQGSVSDNINSNINRMFTMISGVGTGLLGGMGQGGSGGGGGGTSGAFGDKKSLNHVINTIGQGKQTGGGTGGGGGSVIRLYLIGWWWTETKGKEFFNELNNYSHRYIQRRGQDLIHVKSFSTQYQRWEPIALKPFRSMDTVYLNVKVKEELMSDINKFLFKQKWFQSKGIPYHRGYLLHGPPGCGKSTLIQALAGVLRRQIAVLNINQEGMNDYVLTNAMKTIQRNSILVLEDIDAMFLDVNRNNGSGKLKSTNNSHPFFPINIMTEKNKVSLSCLLNCLDGIFAVEGLIVFMTTNYPKRLDEALFRPGRCDCAVKLDLADRNQIQCMFRKFYEETSNYTEDLCNEFAQTCPNKAISLSRLQKHLVQYNDSPVDALKNIHELLAGNKSKRHTVLYESIKGDSSKINQPQRLRNSDVHSDNIMESALRDYNNDTIDKEDVRINISATLPPD